MHEPTREALIAEIAELRAELALAKENVRRLTFLIEHPGEALPAEFESSPAQATTPRCDACGADLADRARMLLADGRVICGMCTQVPASQKVTPQTCGRGSA